MFTQYSQKSRGGFTLIELLVSIAIVVILMGIVLYVIDPIKLFHRFRNSQRLQDASTIAEAINIYKHDRETWPTIDKKKGTWQMLGTGTDCDTACGLGYFVSFANNTNQYIDAGGDNPGSSFDFESNEKFSLSLWVALPAPGSIVQGLNGLLSKIANNHGYFVYTVPRVITISPVNLQYLVGFGIASAQNEYQVITVPLLRSPNFNPFRNIIITYDGTASQATRIKMYIDGVLTAGTVDQQGTVGSIANAGTLTIGKGMIYSANLGGIAGPNSVQGAMDDVRVYSGVLDQAAITRIAAGNNPLSTADYTLQDHYTFDDGFGGFVDDAAGQYPGKIINLGGTAWIPSQYTATNKIGGMHTQPTCVDANVDLVPQYLLRVPVDPIASKSDGKSMYAVNRSDSTITVRACNAEGEGVGGILPAPTIEVGF